MTLIAFTWVSQTKIFRLGHECALKSFDGARDLVEFQQGNRPEVLCHRIGSLQPWFTGEHLVDAIPALDPIGKFLGEAQQFHIVRMLGNVGQYGLERLGFTFLIEQQADQSHYSR